VKHRGSRRRDDVARWGIGRRRGVLARLGESGLEIRDPPPLRGDQLVLLLDPLAQAADFRQEPAISPGFLVIRTDIANHMR
jgi:hypothetical protein